MIRLEGVTKLYGSVIGVNDVTLSLESRAYGLIGPNGSGKSTLLNLITGQLRPTLGRLRVFDCDPWNNRELFRRLGVCPERDLLYDNVSGFRWVRYLMELAGYSRHEAAERAESGLAQVGMTHAMHRAMGGYSRGMRQRTKLAQAFAHEPEVLILDEPFSGLDPVGRHQMSELFRRWIGDGKCLLLASHILHEVEAITDSFLLICNGRLLASSSSEEVHQLLADVPNEITIRCRGGNELARRALEEESVESVRFDDEGRTLVLSTRTPATLYARLPHWVDGDRVQIDELRCSDDSLQTLFASLMRIHRGGS